jgi:hypothetical protein
MAAYVEAVRYRAAWLAKPEAFEAPEELVQLGVRVAGPSAPTRRAVLLRRAAVAIPAAACLIAVVWIGVRGLARPLALPEPVGATLALRAEHGQGLFLAGAPLSATDPAETIRGANDLVALEHAADSLNAAYVAVRDRRHTADAFVRVAYPIAVTRFAQGDLPGSIEVLDQVRSVAPDDCRCRTLRAAISLANSDTVVAEDSLSHAIQRGCNDATVRMDLALIHAARGDTGAAFPVFREMAGRDDALGTRAKAELEVRD